MQMERFVFIGYSLWFFGALGRFPFFSSWTLAAGTWECVYMDHGFAGTEGGIRGTVLDNLSGVSGQFSPLVIPGACCPVNLAYT